MHKKREHDLRSRTNSKRSLHVPERLQLQQSVLSTLFEYITPGERCKLVPKIASGFGGGIGLCGSVCGSLTGSIMAVGVKYGSNESGEDNNAKAYAKSSELFKRFEKQHGSVICRELIKFDLSKPEQLAKAREKNVFIKLCVNFVATAVENFLEMDKKQR